MKTSFLLLGLLVASHLAEGHRQLQQLTPSKPTPGAWEARDGRHILKTGHHIGHGTVLSAASSITHDEYAVCVQHLCMLAQRSSRHR